MIDQQLIPLGNLLNVKNFADHAPGHYRTPYYNNMGVGALRVIEHVVDSYSETGRPVQFEEEGDTTLAARLARKHILLETDPGHFAPNPAALDYLLVYLNSFTPAERHKEVVTG